MGLSRSSVDDAVDCFRGIKERAFAVDKNPSDECSKRDAIQVMRANMTDVRSFCSDTITLGLGSTVYA